MIGDTMWRLLDALDALDAAGVEAYGMAHGNGAVQLTLKGDPETTEGLLNRFHEAVTSVPDESDEEEA